MTIKVACPTCSKSYQLPETLAGKSSKCVNCGEVLKVPSGEPSRITVPAKSSNSPPGEQAHSTNLGPWVNLRRVRAGVAAIFGGVLGIHKLILRQYITGIIIFIATVLVVIFSVGTNTWQIAYYGIGFIEFVGILEGLTLLIMNDEAFVYCYGPRVAKK